MDIEQAELFLFILKNDPDASYDKIIETEKYIENKRNNNETTKTI